MYKRIWNVFVARNREFFRDKAGLTWSIIFPLFIILGFGLVFGGASQDLFKAGIIENATHKEYSERFHSVKYIEFIEFTDRKEAENKLYHHKLDIVFDASTNEYIVNETSPKGYIAEALLKYSVSAQPKESPIKKTAFSKKEIPYVEWLFPGILGMNIMFSALFGVGYVLVRYRKNGVLKRLSITPLRAWEFLTAQVVSRLFVIITTTAFIFFVVKLIYGFRCEGRYIDLLVLYFSGAFAMISVGLVIASRFASEELTDGILNFITWPMMFLSEVWFSLEGTSPWVKTVSKFSPLTHITDATRRIMNEGATLYDIRYDILILLCTGFVLLIAGSLLFRWDRK
jgi:ABC-2 type transport system permease protein